MAWIAPLQAINGMEVLAGSHKLFQAHLLRGTSALMGQNVDFRKEVVLQKYAKLF